MYTLYDTIKTYGKGKGEGMMWQSVEIISDSVEKHLSQEEKEELIADIYGLMSDGHYNEWYAKECVSKMYYVDKDGKKHYAPYWPQDAVHDIYEKNKSKIPSSYNEWDWCVTFNMIASDNWNIIHEWWPEISEGLFAQKITEMTINWLSDPDFDSKSKIWDYMHA